MAATKTNYNGKHQLSQKCKGPKQDTLKLWTTKSPKIHRNLTIAQIDRYLSQTKIHKQWEADMERLNTKYNLDCFSDSELDSESDEREEYKYEHGYETLI